MIHSLFPGDGASPALFFTLAGSAAASGRLLALALYPHRAERAAGAAAWLLLAYACIVLPCTALGAAGLLRPAPMTTAALFILTASLAVFTAARRTKHAPPSCEMQSPGPALPAWSAAPFAAAGLCAAFVALVWGVAAPPPPWDAFVYHLPFAANWLQNGAISLVTVPFGDQAGTYFPSNTELYFAWLMMPLRSEMLTSAAQFPFYLGAGVAVYAVARELGRSRTAACAAASLGLLIPGFMRQTTAAEVDVVFATLFLTSLLFLLRFFRTNAARDALLSGLGGGLLAGTKYIGAPFLLLLAAPALAVAFKRRAGRALALYALAGVCGGGFWYARNWLATGNPVFPMTVSLFGIEAFPGGYTRDTMLQSIFHARSAGQWLDAMREATGAPLGALLCAAVPAGLAASWRSAHRARAAYACLLAPALIAVFAFAVPYNLEARFTFAAWLLACVCAAHAMDAPRASLRVAAWSACAAAAAASLSGNEFFVSRVSMIRQILTARPDADQPADLLLAMRPCVALLCAGALAAAAGVFAARRASGAMRAAGVALAAAGLGAALLAPFAGLPAYRQYRHAYAREFHLGHAWRFLEAYQAQAGPAPAVIAYTGSDLCFGLYGPTLENRVVHAAVTAHPDWKFHDCVRALKGRGEYQVPDTDRIDFCRRDADPEAWVRNLDALGAQFVVIARLHQNDRPHLPHDEYGFPEERAWAQARPHRFRLIYPLREHNPDALIYRVLPAPAP